MPVSRLLNFSEPQFTGIDVCRLDQGVSIVRWSGLNKGVGPECAYLPAMLEEGTFLEIQWKSYFVDMQTLCFPAEQGLVA